MILSRRRQFKLLLILSVIVLLCACQSTHYRKGRDLDYFDLAYLRKLGVLFEGEQVLLFDSQGAFKGVKVSGNFITDKRIAAYWIDEDDQSKTKINYGFYTDVADIRCRYVKALTYASYLTVTKMDGRAFKVYIDADSAAVYNFYNQAVLHWKKSAP